MRGNEEFIIETFKIDANFLQYATADLRGNKEVVLKAVTHHGGALKYAKKELRYNKIIVKAAINNFIVQANDNKEKELKNEQ